MSCRQIGIKYAKHINRARPDIFVGKHKRFGHVGKEPEGRLPPDPQSMTGQKVERHRKSVDERIDEIYKCGMAIFALGFEGRDLHGAAKGLAEARAATALMGKPTEGTSQLQQTINIDFSKLSDDELKTYATLGRKLETGTNGVSPKASP